ncbi:hypothetical protein AB0D08_12170 [Kitasatospora sp. NPDC048540]|uniref:hypothetical protein n=1 Tax=Kitasatospora sp. NPDC048540 TaxID=3155634 RepID=UPI0033C099D8
MKRPGCLLAAVGAAIVLGLLGRCTALVLDPASGGPDNRVAAADSRVCAQTGGNNLPLAEATAHFGLAVPPAATDLVFTADAGGLQGDFSLTLRFTTTPADLATFLSAGDFEPPSAATTVSTGDWTTYEPGAAVRPAGGPCGLTPPVGPAIVYSRDGRGYAGKAGPRSLAVDGATDPAHPVVWVSAVDL